MDYSIGGGDMRLVDNGVIRKLIPEKGCKIFSQHMNEYYDIVYLGKNDSINNYTEVLADTLTEPISMYRLDIEIDDIINS